MKTIALFCAAILSLSSIFGGKVAAAQTTTELGADIPYKMQPATVIVYDNNGKGSIVQGGMLDLPEQSMYHTDVIPNMKVVYNEITGDIDNIYYPDSFCKADTIHGEQIHLYQKVIELKKVDACSLFFAFGLQRPMHCIAHFSVYGELE